MFLGLGTAALGRPQYINIRQENVSNQNLEDFKQNGFRVLEEAYRIGIRYFDTAPGYGLAENLLLEWVKTKNDPTIHIATKWGYTYVANFDTNAKIHEVKEHSLTKLNEQWEVSKSFLPYIKVYQIHSATLETMVLENSVILERLAFLKETYNLKIGITTTGANQVEVIKKALGVSVKGNQLFDTYQVTYNILDQSIREVSEVLDNQKKQLVIKEAMANGRLFENSTYKHYDKLYKVLEMLAKKYEVGIDAIALNFCKCTLPNAKILSGAASIAHIKQNAQATTFRLTTDEILLLSTFEVDPTLYWQERKQLAWN
ncbi:aldo/keto reductase [Aquimarina sp. 2201CG1-2-11]|uniref:aldo/keto reductase n=1 Tax=Aquimarina discodermiae TaxID=3231043 RepID=UPI0034638264